MKMPNTALAQILVFGTALDTAVLAAGFVWYLLAHSGQPAEDHVFTGEPHFLRSPADMLHRVFSPGADERRRALMMTGLLLLLLNPPLRVALASLEWFLEKDRLYAGIALGVLGVLLLSLSGI